MWTCLSNSFCLMLVKPGFVFFTGTFQKNSGGERIVRRFPEKYYKHKISSGFPFLFLVSGIRISELNSTFPKLFPYHLLHFRELYGKFWPNGKSRPQTVEFPIKNHPIQNFKSRLEGNRNFEAKKVNRKQKYEAVKQWNSVKLFTEIFWHQSEARATPTIWNWSVKTLSPWGLFLR